MKNPSLRETTWGDLVKVKQGKYVAPSELSSDRIPKSPIPTVGANGVLGFVATSSYGYRVPLITCRGSNCGLIQYPTEPVWVSNNAMGLDAGSQEDNDFIYYLALATDFSDIVTGSAQPQITAGPLKTKRVSVPDHTHWAGIAATLGALDDKIESNRKAVHLAEQLGDQVFAANSTETVVLAEISNLTMGSSPPGESYNELGEGMPFYQGIRDFGRRFPGHRVWTTRVIRRAKDNDTLVSVRAPVGRLNRSREVCCIGRGVAAVSSNSPSTAFYALRAADAVWEPFQHEGTVFGAINKADLSNAKLHSLTVRPG